jgi:hypothetical protein
MLLAFTTAVDAERPLDEALTQKAIDLLVAPDKTDQLLSRAA